MSGRDDVSNEYLLHSLAQGEVSPEVAAATSLTVEVRQLRAERTTPAPVSGAGLDLDARVARYGAAIWDASRHDEGTISWTGANVVARAVIAVADAEVRRLTSHADGLSANLGGDLIAWAARAEAAEAEVVTLRARLAAVEALADQWADRKRSDGMSGNAWIGLTLSGMAADLRAALATTGKGQ